MNMNKKLFIASLALLPSMAFAHPGHADNFASAFAHPFTGIDHLLMMLCVGIFAGRIGGHARWQLPLTFLSAMTAGWMMAAAGYIFAGIDSGIAAGLIVLGVMLMTRIAMPLVLQLCVVAVFAALHGAAHGVELSRGTLITTTIGFLAATALIHGVGLGIVALWFNERKNAYRVIGVVLTVIGGELLLGF